MTVLELPLLPSGPSLDAVQGEMIEAIVERRSAGRPSAILQAATGVGKTYTTAKFIRRGLAEWDGRFLFLAHRKELVEQAAAEFRDAGLPFAVEMADRKALGAMSLYGGVPVVIASKDTLQKHRLESWPRDAFTDVIADEAHLSVSDTFRRVFDHFSGATFRLGLTATPYRMDGSPLYGHDSAPFEAIAYRYDLATAISNGHLADVCAVTCNTGVDLKGVRTTKRKDFNAGDLEDRVSRAVEPLANAARIELDRLGIRKALLFSPDVGSAHAFAAALSQIGIPAKAVHGHSKAHPMGEAERASIVRAYRQGEFRVLCSCELLTTGFNDRPTEAVIIARPTKSLGLFMQIVGRATRTYPGKAKCYAIGYAWEGADGVVSSVDLFLADEPDPAVRSAARRLERASKGERSSDLIDRARELVKREREEEAIRAARTLRVSARKRDVKYRRTEFSPFTAPAILGLDRPLFRDVKAGPLEPPSPAVARALMEYGMKDLSGLDREGARAVLGSIADREFKGLASPKMVLFLQRIGYRPEVAREMSGREARRIFVEQRRRWGQARRSG